MSERLHYQKLFIDPLRTDLIPYQQAAHIEDSMFTELLHTLSSEISAERAYDHVLALSRFHRIQASPGYRRAAEYCIDHLLEDSGDARLIHYPAERGASFWHFPSFDEWSIKQAVLKIISPPELAAKLADFNDCAISVIQRSKATPPHGIAAEVIDGGDGRTEKDFKRARGKIALCDAWRASHVYEAAASAGVSGIILYKQRHLPGVRFGSGVYGARQYNSFWWDENELFGFVLTPEDGDRLANHLRSQRRPVKAWALVESETYPGTLEVVTSLIAGREDREVLVIAHLCHPKPSADDNASGVAALLEIHKVLSNLIERQILPQPRFGIRFLLVPEITGTFAYLSREHSARQRLVTGLNLDMVGQRQDVTGSTLCIEAPPMASGGFIHYLIEHAARKVLSHKGDTGLSSDLLSVRMQTTSFSGGSDHYVLSDPLVGVPTAMLIQWPDLFYHTSADTPDKVSPEMLRSIGLIGAAVIYTLARADENDLKLCADIVGQALRRDAVDKMAEFAQSDAPMWVSLEFEAGLLLEYGRKVLMGLGSLHPRSKSLQRRIRDQMRAYTKCVKAEAEVCDVASLSASMRKRAHDRIKEQADHVVRRLIPGPVYPEHALRRTTGRRRSRYNRWRKREAKADLIWILSLFWADGERSIADISRVVAAEIGETNPDLVRLCFEISADAGLVEFVKRRG